MIELHAGRPDLRPNELIFFQPFVPYQRMQPRPAQVSS